METHNFIRIFFKIEIIVLVENTEMTVVGEVFSLWDPLSQHNIESLFATRGGNFKKYLVFVAFVKKYFANVNISYLFKSLKCGN